MHNNLDTLLDLRRRLYRTLDAGITEFTRPSDSFTPPLDIVSGPEGLTITVELPGMAREDIDIELQGNLLTISGERVPASLRDAGPFARRERPAGRFARSLALPTSDERELAAALKDGVLTIKVTRNEGAA